MDETESPELEGAGLADNLSLAFSGLLEELAPSERAAFLLRDVFGYGYGEIARTPGPERTRLPPVGLARPSRIGDRRKRFEADHEAAGS